MKTVFVFLHTNTGNMEVYSSLESFKKYNSDYIIGSNNANGDMVVERPNPKAPWPTYVGYLQERTIFE